MYSQTYLDELQKSACKMKELLSGLKGTRILVTGASGLIGSALVDVIEYASEEYHLEIGVYAAGRNMGKLKERFSYWEKLSCIEYDALQEMDSTICYDYVIHCASNAHPAAYMKEPVETMLVNFCGMNRILEHVKKQEKNCRVLYVSSSEVYGSGKADKSWYTEEQYYDLDILNVRACYPSSKRATETLCKAYIEEYGMDIVIVRPGHVYGPTMTAKDTRASAQFFRDVLNEQDIIMKSAGEQLRSYCYVMDCVTAMLTVLCKGKCGEAYNISNRRSVVTIRELAFEIASQTGRNVIFENPTDREQKSYNFMQISALDAGKLERLGWEGSYDLCSGVKSTLKILEMSSER